MFNRLTLRIVAILLMLLLCVSPVNAQLGSVPYTFTSGTTILSTEVNANFTTAYANALNRTGGTLTGTLSVSADVTIDGVDISDFLDPSGIVFAGTVGAVGAPSFSRTGDTNTGLYFPAADEVAITLGGVQKILYNASGVTAYGVNIINSSGKIPALSTTYFASVDGSALTSLTAANVSGSHTLPDAVLSTNVPLLNAANVFTNATNTFGTSLVVATDASIFNSSGFLVLSSGNATYVRASSVGSINLADNNASAVNIATGGGLTTISGNTRWATSQVMSWNAKSLDTTVGPALSDGFVVVALLGADTPWIGGVVIKSDSSTPPTTVRAKETVTNQNLTVTFPVRKGDYFLITTSTSSGSATATINWVPLGTGG